MLVVDIHRMNMNSIVGAEGQNHFIFNQGRLNDAAQKELAKADFRDEDDHQARNRNTYTILRTKLEGFPALSKSTC